MHLFGCHILFLDNAFRRELWGQLRQCIVTSDFDFNLQIKNINYKILIFL